MCRVLLPICISGPPLRLAERVARGVCFSLLCGSFARSRVGFGEYLRTLRASALSSRLGVCKLCGVMLCFLVQYRLVRLAFAPCLSLAGVVAQLQLLPLRRSFPIVCYVYLLFPSTPCLLFPSFLLSLFPYLRAFPTLAFPPFYLRSFPNRYSTCPFLFYRILQHPVVPSYPVRTVSSPK